jgi:HSP20 family protein
MAEEKKSEVQVSKGKAGEVERMPSRIMSPFEEFERLFDEFLPRGWLRPWRGERMREMALPFEGKLPKLDVIDRDADVLVRVEVPGVNKDDIEISLTGNLFTVKGNTRREEKEEKGDYYRCEISQGSFSRTVSLPAEVDESQAKAQLTDGILEITLPKVEKAKKRSIKIN